ERQVVDVRRAPSQAAAAGSSRSVGDLLRFTKAARRAKLDAFVFPSLYTYFPVVGAPTVVGVHGTTTTEFRELTLPTRKDALFWRLKEGSAIRRATRLFTVSEAARAALVDKLGLRAERVAVVPEAPDSAFRPRSLGEVREALAGLGLPADRPYVLFAGGLSPARDV